MNGHSGEADLVEMGAVAEFSQSLAPIDMFTTPCFNPVRSDFARGGGMGDLGRSWLPTQGSMVMRFLGDFLGKLLTNERGATAIEYAMIASMISVAAVAAFVNLGSTVENRFSAIDQTLNGTI